MIFVDVHAHLDSKEFELDLDEVIKKAKEDQIKVIITSGTDSKTNLKALILAEKYDIVKLSLGIYPPDALSRETGASSIHDVDEEINFIKKNRAKILAIGEVGLDFLDKNSKKEEQKMIFVRMIELSKELKLPLIVHSRKAEKEVLEILKDNKAEKVLLHCFMGKNKLIKEAEELGYYFSVPPNIVRAQNFQNLVKLVNINKILTETDAPYLGPVRDERNVPSNVVYAVKKIAEIKGFTEEDVANNIFLNYQRLFL